MSLVESSSHGHQVSSMETFFLSDLEDDASPFDTYSSTLELRRAKTLGSGTKPLYSSPLAGPALASVPNDSGAPTPAPHVRLRPTSSHARSESSTSIIRLSSIVHNRPYSPYALPARRTPSPSRPESSIQLQPTPRTPPRTPSPLSIRSTHSSVQSSAPNRTSKVLEDVRNRPLRLSVHDPIKPPQPARLRKRPATSESHSDPQSQDTYGICPSFLPAPAPTKVKSDSDKAGTPDESWYTANTYELTPKFTRLGLSAPNVIMPVSAREHRKKMHRNSALAPTGPVDRGHPIPPSPTPSSPSSTSGSRRASTQAHAPLPESVSSNDGARRSHFHPSLSSFISVSSSPNHRPDSPTLSGRTTPNAPASLMYSLSLASPRYSAPLAAPSPASSLPSHAYSLAGTGSSGSGLISPDPDERSLDAPCICHNRDPSESKETVQENHARTPVQYQHPVTPPPISIPVPRIRKSFLRLTMKRKSQPSSVGVETQPQVQLNKATTLLRSGEYRTDVKVEIADRVRVIEPMHPRQFYGGFLRSGSDSISTAKSGLDGKGRRLSVSEDARLDPTPPKRKPSTVRRLWRTLTGGGGKGRSSRVG